jgi:hypothetical protein
MAEGLWPAAVIRPMVSRSAKLSRGRLVAGLGAGGITPPALKNHRLAPLRDTPADAAASISGCSPALTAAQYR